MKVERLTIQMARCNIKSVLSLYQGSSPIEAIQALFFHPFICYDVISPTSFLAPPLINYFDSLTYGHYFHGLACNQILKKKFLGESCSFIEDSFFYQLNQECFLLFLLFKTEEELIQMEKEEVPGTLPYHLIKLSLFKKQEKRIPIELGGNCQTLRKQISFWNNILTFKKSKPDYYELIFRKPYPFYPHSYQTSLFHQNSIKDSIDSLNKRTPVIFVETHHFLWETILGALSEKPSIFIFYESTSFFQALQFPFLLDLLLKPYNLIYIISIYPTLQFKAQPQWRSLNTDFHPISLSQSKQYTSIQPQILSYLRDLFSEMKEPYLDTSSADNLFKLGLYISRMFRLNRLGSQRALPYYAGLSRELRLEKECTQTTVVVPKDEGYNKKIKSYRGGSKKKQTISSVSPWKVAHIIPLLKDNAHHAPLTRLTSLLKEYNRELFSPMVYSTQTLHPRECEYPYNKVKLSFPYFVPKPDLIEKFESWNIPVYYDKGTTSYEQSASAIVKHLESSKVEIVIFHSQNLVADLVLQMSDFPLKVYFEHGSPLPEEELYDALILSHREDLPLYKERYDRLGVELFANPVALDIKNSWPLEGRVSKRDLGFNEGDRLMTTVSSHLNSRLSCDMCVAITRILQRVPTAYYAPIGSVEGLDWQFSIFKHYGVEKQVIALGEHDSPGWYLQAFDLYLNEFPFGSGIASLEALAAGCPILSMYDKKGVLDAREGANYFSPKRAIHSLSIDEYVERACQLLTSQEMHDEWKQEALSSYERHSDPIAYARRHEKILLQLIESKLKN